MYETIAEKGGREKERQQEKVEIKERGMEVKMGK